MNLRDTRIYDTIHEPVGSTTRVLNAKETMLAQQKQEQIRKKYIMRSAEDLQEVQYLMPRSR